MALSLAGGPEGTKGEEGGGLLDRAFSLFAFSLPQNEQLHSATSSLHDGLPHRSHQQSQWRIMTQIYFPSLRLSSQVSVTFFPTCSAWFIGRAAHPGSARTFFTPSAQHWLLAPIATGSPSGTTHCLLLVRLLECEIDVSLPASGIITMQSCTQLASGVKLRRGVFVSASGACCLSSQSLCEPQGLR